VGDTRRARHRKKRGFATLGYLVTALGTGAIALTQGLAALVSARSAAWLGRGFRSPLRDFMLADEVGPTHFGRAYGIERAADMLGAVAGPLGRRCFSGSASTSARSSW
jgi:hypothetical protein